MDPKVYPLLKSLLPEMIDILEEIALERKLIDSGRRLVKEHSLEGQPVFSCWLEGNRFLIRDYSVDYHLTQTDAETIEANGSSLKEDEVYSWSQAGTILTIPFLLSEVMSGIAKSDGNKNTFCLESTGSK
jgi:hypothetical protein